MKKISSYVAGLLIAVFVFAACKKNDTVNTRIPAAGLMAFNLVPDKNAIGVTLSGNDLTGAPINFNGFTGAYLPVYVGASLVNSIDAATGSTLASVSQTFSDSMYYSLFVVGKTGNYRNIIVNDSLNKLTVSSGNAFVRFINAIPDSAVSPTVVIASGDSNSFNTNAPFGTVSPFATIKAGSIDIKVNGSDSIAASRTITVEESKVYTILLSGMPGATDTTKSVQIKYITNGTVTP